MSGRGREVILGIGGGIAAYKAADLLRRLQDQGYLVTVVPTPSSLNFVGTSTWEALSGREVNTEVWQNVSKVTHVSLAAKADFFLIAPATADLIARIAAGRADDLLTNLIMASDKPKFLVPAMHPNMWSNPATQANVAILQSRGFVVMQPAVGRLTGDEIGVGRFPETPEILKEFNLITQKASDLIGKRVLVTAGGTREAIDPVRFIGNNSSGKQGLAIAKAASMRGAKVHLIAANMPNCAEEGIQISHVKSADDVQQVLQKEFERCDLLIMVAAIADAKPKSFSVGKIKKSLFGSIELESNPDILAELSKMARSNQVLVGFAAETSDLLGSALEKLKKKGLNLIYVNDVSNGAIFGSEETQGMILINTGERIDVATTTKGALANLLLDKAIEQLG